MLGLQTCASEASSVWILGFKIQVLTLMRQNITHQSHFPRPTLSTKPLMPSRRCLLKTSFRYNYFPNALPLNTINTGPRGLSSQLSTWRVYIHLQKCVHVIVGSDPITPCLATLRSPTRYTAPTAYPPCLPGGPILLFQCKHVFTTLENPCGQNHSPLAPLWLASFTLQHVLQVPSVLEFYVGNWIHVCTHTCSVLVSFMPTGHKLESSEEGVPIEKMSL